jgi:DNA (cytosine-5)-methyltransferase 1
VITDADLCHDHDPAGRRCQRWTAFPGHWDGWHQNGHHRWPVIGRTGKPVALELFGGAQGAAVGYARAGLEVHVVDVVEHETHPEVASFMKADAVDVLADDDYLDRYDVITGGPPCQRWAESTPEHRRAEHPDLVTPMLGAVRRWAQRTGGLWVIENVRGAPLPDPVLICGRAMGLRWFKRHRHFASNAPLLSPGCACGSEPPFGVYGDHGDLTVPRRPNGTSRGRKARDVDHAREVTGNDWMTDWDDLADSIPWRYTRFIGEQVLEQLQRAVVAS